MNPLAKALRFWHTVRHLKPVQVYGRARFRLTSPAIDLRPAPERRRISGAWALPARREASMNSPTQLQFLDEERDLDLHGWDDPALAKLWRYHQHYFDDLTAFESGARAPWHRALIRRWIDECPPGVGTAWEPYPTSLRLVNWIKWINAGNEPVAGMLESMAIQARHLSKRLEWHLLGNHLFVNAKALVIVGSFFEGPEADAWRALGWRILRAEIVEQILQDGMQFERSPMYHALATEDMLDLLNAMNAWPRPVLARDREHVVETIALMRRSLAVVCHPDGGVAHFNDSVSGVAPTRTELEDYASRLGLPPTAELINGVMQLPDAGYVRVQRGEAVAILDLGEVGPDYLPGHAHADTLSFELSLGGKRVLVNSGISQYGLGAERLRQRGTPAHNTVSVRGLDSSEVWGGFRVARRAKIVARRVVSQTDGAFIEAAHDGFLRLAGGGLHRRRWTFRESVLRIEDESQPWAESASHWHFAPGFELSLGADGRTLRASDGTRTVTIAAEGADWQVSRSTYFPRFGVLLSNQKAVARFTGPAPHFRIEWSTCTSSS